MDPDKFITQNGHRVEPPKPIKESPAASRVQRRGNLLEQIRESTPSDNEEVPVQAPASPPPIMSSPLRHASSPTPAEVPAVVSAIPSSLPPLPPAPEAISAFTDLISRSNVTSIVATVDKPTKQLMSTGAESIANTRQVSCFLLERYPHLLNLPIVPIEFPQHMVVNGRWRAIVHTICGDTLDIYCSESTKIDIFSKNFHVSFINLNVQLSLPIVDIHIPHPVWKVFATSVFYSVLFHWALPAVIIPSAAGFLINFNPAIPTRQDFDTLSPLSSPPQASFDPLTASIIRLAAQIAYPFSSLEQRIVGIDVLGQRWRVLDAAVGVAFAFAEIIKHAPHGNSHANAVTIPEDIDSALVVVEKTSIEEVD
jgi:hypothetical protein